MTLAKDLAMKHETPRDPRREQNHEKQRVKFQKDIGEQRNERNKICRILKRVDENQATRLAESEALWKDLNLDKLMESVQIAQQLPVEAENTRATLQQALEELKNFDDEVPL